MSVSSINNNYWALYNKLTNSSSVNKSTSTDSTQQKSILESLPGLIRSNIDGDTFQLTGASSTSGAAYNSNGSSSNSNLDLKSFLDKVANGTVTVSDLENMQSKLQSWSTGNSQAPPPPPGGNSGDDPIRNFLDKVSNGTATSSDLQSMQSVLQSMSANSAQVATNGNSKDDPIKTFLDKIAAGTATTTDLESMQKVLQQMQQSSSSQGHRHHHKDNSQSNNTSTSQNSTSMDLKSFLEKIVQGTVTSDDLKTMQSELQKFQQQLASSQN